MRGFLRRDLALVANSGRVYLVFILLFALMGLFIDSFRAMGSVYVFVFTMSSVVSLFGYDDANHWQGYAAAMPNGRRDMVAARYWVALLGALVVGAFSLASGLLSPLAMALGLSHAALPHGPALSTALLFTGICLLYADLMLPLYFRFGGAKGRMMAVAIMGVMAGLMGAGAAIWGIASGAFRGEGQTALPLPVGAAVLAAGAVGLPLSRRLSQRIQEKKEL